MYEYIVQLNAKITALKYLNYIRHLTLKEERSPAKGRSHLKMLMKFNERYYDLYYNTDGLST